MPSKTFSNLLDSLFVVVEMMKKVFGIKDTQVFHSVWLPGNLFCRTKVLLVLSGYVPEHNGWG